MRNTREQYVAEWAAKTGKSTREIYVPESLQPASGCPECGWARFSPSSNDGPGNHINCVRGRW